MEISGADISGSLAADLASADLASTDLASEARLQYRTTERNPAIGRR